MQFDQLDARLLLELTGDPRIGVMELARRLGVARGTAHARLRRLEAAGLLGREGGRLDFEALGYPVTAFVTLEISQGRISEVVEPLAAIPEVLEVHTIAGQGDLLVRVVARSNDDLFRIIELALASPFIERSSTAISLVEHVPYRTAPFMEKLAAR